MMFIDRHRLFSWILLVMAFCAPVSLRADAPRPATPGLEEGFRTPPEAARPWAYYWWVNGNVDTATIARDLAHMKEKGFGGLLLFDSRGYHDDHLPPPPPRMEFMSPEWRKLLRFTISEAARLGLQVSVNLSSSAGALGGPWPVGEDAPKKLVWAAREVQGGGHLVLQVNELSTRGWTQARDIALLAVRRDAKTRRAVDVVDLSNKIKEGRLDWDAPSGEWTLLRFAYAFIEGHLNDVDILDPDAVRRYFERMGRPMLQDAGPLAGGTLSHFYSVSWEGAIPTWSPRFEFDFQRMRGYSIRPWLPALAGMTVKTQEQTERFMRDFYATLGEGFRQHCYGVLKKLSNEASLQWHSESGGPWTRTIPSFGHADQLAFLGVNDMPQGEFWWPERGLTRPIAMAANIYGLPLAAVEAFTNMKPHWSDYPAVLKPCGDAAFCDGANHFIWHTFTASPPEFGKPGIEYFAGSHLNPNVTWFDQSGAFIQYLTRCQFMLRRGRPVVDVCTYVGDRPYLHWGRSRTWNEKSPLKMPAGYTFDLINTPALLERLSIKDGLLVLPGGMSYRMLVVDPENETIPPAALSKIAELARAGATVVLGRRPKRAPGLTDYPACDLQVARTALELWGVPGMASGKLPFGKGSLLRGVTMEAALKEQGIRPDCEGPWDYAHRREGDADIYFLKGTGAAEMTFRVQGKEPELWDPVSGERRDAVCWCAADGRTIVPLNLPENGSVFVVFRRPAESRRLDARAALEKGVEIAGRNGDSVILHRWVVDEQTLAGPWDVRFAPGWGAPEKAVFEKLIGWHNHSEAGIRHFSGTAKYLKEFELSEPQARGLARLELGDVRNIARVRLNGKDLGIIWTAPWRVELTGAVKPGRNALEIEVTNTWVNRLIGDAALPEEKRLTKTIARRPANDNSSRAFLKGYKADDLLAPSGLIGPVRLCFGTREERQLPAAP